MLDENNYPDEKDLERIKNYDLRKEPIEGLLKLVLENTQFGEYSFRLTGKRVLKLEYHTFGWSGNEDVIDALHHNFIFWSMCWRIHRAGGHYWFRIDKKRFKEVVPIK